jgi:4-amino-4-deoxy-L-arabinose transferase-like glycosyltransferase
VHGHLQGRRAAERHLGGGRGSLEGLGLTRFYRWLAAIVAFGLALRALQTLLVAPWPPGFFNDEAYYNALAQLIAHGVGFVRPAEFLGDGLTLPTAERAPLFPLLLAGLAKLGLADGDLRLLGLLTGGGTIAVLGLLGRRVGGARAGLLAAGIAALYPTLIAADGALMTESLYGLLAALALLLAYRLLDAPTLGWALALGAILGLAAHARAEALLLTPLLLVPLLRRPGGLKTCAAVCVACALVLVPWTVRNWSEFDRPVLIATEGGETLAGANCEQVYYGEDIGNWRVSCVDFSGRGNEAAELNEAGRDGIRYAREHLGRVPIVAAARFARTWGLYRPFAVPEGRRAWVMHLGAGIYFLLIPLAVCGFVLLRRRHVPVWILMTPFITVTVTTLLAYGQIRFRHSAELSLVVLSAVALDRLLPSAAEAGTSARD